MVEEGNLKSTSTTIRCPICDAVAPTRTETKSNVAHLASLAVMAIPMLWIPFLFGTTVDRLVTHYCSACGVRLGTYQRVRNQASLHAASYVKYPPEKSSCKDVTTRPRIPSPLHRGLSSVEYGQSHELLTVTLTPGESLYNGVWTVNAVGLGHKYVAVTADIPPAITEPDGITYHPDYIKIVNAWSHRDLDRDPPSAQIERLDQLGTSVGKIVAVKGQTHDWDIQDTYRNWRSSTNVPMPRELDASKEEWQSSEGPLFWSNSFRKGFVGGAGKTYILHDAYGQVVARYTHAKGRTEPYMLHLDRRLDDEAIDVTLIVVLCMSTHWEQWYEAEKYVDHGG